MSKQQYFSKLAMIYAGIWALALAWLAGSGMTPNWFDRTILPVFAAGILFYPSIATGLICNRITEMGRWLIGSLTGIVSAVIFISLYYFVSPTGLDIISFCANGLVASALVSIGTLSAACFVGRYRYV